jgi:hypothetical protein
VLWIGSAIGKTRNRLVRSLIWIPLTLAIVAGAAWGILHAIRHHVPQRELLLALGITVVAAELAMAPMALSHGGGTAAVSQAALLGTVIHLFLTISIAGAITMLHLVSQQSMFLYLLAAFYWISLILLVVASVRAIRKGEVATPAPKRP